MYIERYDNDDFGCYGSLAIGSLDCYTLELPSLNNTPNISCIPAGKYDASIDKNITIGGKYVIRLQDVPDRTGILIHVGNYTNEIAGCILVGNSQHTNSIKKMVTSSKHTMSKLLAEVEFDDEFYVEITGV